MHVPHGPNYARMLWPYHMPQQCPVVMALSYAPNYARISWPYHMPQLCLDVMALSYAPTMPGSHGLYLKLYLKLTEMFNPSRILKLVANTLNGLGGVLTNTFLVFLTIDS